MKPRFKIFFLLGMVLWAENSWSQVSKKRQDLQELLDKTARLPSENDRIKRAELMDQASLPLTAMLERGDALRFINSKESELQKLGETILSFQALDYGTQIQNRLRDRNLQEAATSLKAAWATQALRIGELARAQQYFPSISELRKLGENAEYKAFMAGGTLKWALNGPTEGGEFWNRTPLNSGFDNGYIFLQKARAAYDQGRMGQVLEELINIPRSSGAWYPGMLMSSWAAYRLKDFNLALGLLMSLHSPYLTAKYNPESYLLEAATFYRLCHFQSAARSLSILRKNYKSFSNSLTYYDRQWGRRFKGVVHALEYARGSYKPQVGIDARDWHRLMDGLLMAEPLADVDRLLVQAQRERNFLSKLSFEKNRYARSLVNTYMRGLEELRLEALRLGLKVVRSRLQDMRREVSEALENALVVDVEINTRLRQRLITGSAPQMKDIDFDTEVKKGFEFWPFQGEYWRDEVGSYVFATSDVCGEGSGG